MTILFLDFDGCCHKVHCKEEGEELFAYLPRIEAVVGKFPDVYVVVSSDCVNGHPNCPSYGHANLPTPVGQLTVSGSSVRIRPALSLSLSRYELPRILSVMA